MGTNLLDFRRAFVTGGAGFIGSHLVDRLLTAGIEVSATTISPPAAPIPRDRAGQSDLHAGQGRRARRAAAEVRHRRSRLGLSFRGQRRRALGAEHPRKNLEQNTIATYNVLEAMRAGGVRTLLLASTGSIYGEADIFPTPEDAPFPVQTSLYGA